MYRGEVKVNFGKPELEGYWYAGSDEGQKPEVACILSHPHPKLGGDMRNNVVAALAFSLQNTGRYMTLRFNTRGVGRSKGSSTWTGKSERNDFIAAVSFVRGQENVKKIYFVGYSFGSAVGLSANKAYGEVVDGYIAISYPKGFFSSFLFSSHYKLADSNKDKLFIHGDNDDFASIPTIRAFVERLSSPKSLEVVKGVDHFWHGQESSLVEIVLKWLDSRILN